ncbi:MAG: hypothetical protein SPK22_05540, partial [Alloprevotella sp.]|nr:hypothetical protein [Bacteroidales bacterium]MDY5769660.1 hypothetical protein [Alloprevotella sp.]
DIVYGEKYEITDIGFHTPTFHIIHLIKIDNQINRPTDFQQKCRLSVGLLLAFPNGCRAKPSTSDNGYRVAGR